MEDFIPDKDFVPDTHAGPPGPAHDESFIPDSEFVSDEQKYGEGLGPLKAAALSAGRIATFGGTDYFLTHYGLMKPEDIKGYEEQDPIATGVGAVGGVLGSVLAPEAGILGALSAPIKAVSKLGGAVTEGVAGAIASSKASPVINKILSQAGAHAAGSAVEGVAYGLGQSVTEHALGDPDLNGEKILSNVGVGALTGGALGSLFGAGKVAIPAAIEKAGLKTEAAGELVGKALAKASSVVSGKPVEDIAGLTKGIGTEEGIAMRKNALEGYKEREATARELADGLAEQHEAIGKAAKEYYQGARQEEISALMSEVPHEAAFNAAVDEAGKIKSAIKEMRSEPELYSATGKVRQLELVSEGLEKKLENAKTSEEIYHAINDAKQQVDPLAKFQGVPTDAERATINRIKDVRYGLKTHLENPQVYGEAGARQGALNSVYSEFASASKDFTKTFGRKLSNGDVKIDPGKVNTFLGQMGRPGADIKQQILSEYLESSQALAKQMEETSKNSIKRVDTDKLMDLFQKTQGIAEGAESELEAVNQMKRLKGFGDEGIVGGAAKAGAAAHFINPAVGAAYAVYHTLKNPAEMIRVLSTVERAAQKATNAINKGSSAIFKASEAGSAVRTYGAFQFASKDDRRDNHDSLHPELSEMSANPEKLIDHLTKNTEELSQVAPKTSESVQGAMTRATQFLQSKLPGNGIPQKPLSPKYKPSEAELSKWHKYFSAVENPTDVLHAVAVGNLVPETMEALSVVYPKMLSEMRMAVTDKMTDALSKKKVIPYRTKLSLSLFLGSDLVNSLDPKSMLATQNMMSTAAMAHAAQQQPQMGSVNKKSLGKMDKSNRLLTAAQSSAQRQEA